MLRLSTIALGLAALLAPQPPGGQQPTFRSGTQVVSLFVTVQDAQKRLVPDLTQDDFQIFDNDKPQPITYFDSSVRPISVVSMLDTSGSMTLTIDLLKQAAEQFVLRLLPDDKARVGAFNDKIQFAGTGFTNDRDDLISDIKDLDYGNGTRLWDAVGASLEQLKGVEGRRVILVFTDGDDTESKLSLGNVTDRARTDEVMIYAIGLESHYFDGQRMVRSKPDRGLRKIADETGGGYFELTRANDLSPTFTQIASELHSQYVIGFAPTQLDNKIHKLTVKMKNVGMTARARRSYVAAPDKFSVSQ
jgi:Ca-activated chloride channel family protein